MPASPFIRNSTPTWDAHAHILTFVHRHVYTHAHTHAYAGVSRYLSTRLYIRWNLASAVMLTGAYKGVVCSMFVFYDPLVQARDMR